MRSSVCFRHMYEDQKTRSAIFEGGEEQSAASHISKCSRGAVRLSSAQLCSHAGRFAIQPPSLSVCARLFFQTKNLFSSCLAPDNIRDITKKHLDADTRETKQNIYSLPQMNPVLSLDIFLMADNCGVMHNVILFG